MARLYVLILVGFLLVQTLAETNKNFVTGAAGGPVSSGSGSNEMAGAPSTGPLERQTFDKSVAGGEVIVGGFVMAFFASVFCYIRVTRKQTLEA